MKNVIRQALALAVLATFAALVVHWFNQAQHAPSKLALAMAQPSPQTPLPVVKFDGIPNRKQPSFAPLGEVPEIPAHPTDDQIIASRVLPDHLWAIDGAGLKSDNDALGELLRALRSKSTAEVYAGIEQWLAAHQDSRWRYALLSQLMNYKWSRGYFAEARAGWMEVWTALKDRQDLNSYHLANDVFAHLLDANIGFARADTLRELVDAASRRPLNGPLEGKVFRAREAVWLFDHTAAQNVMCGPLALNAIKQFKGEPFVAPRLSQVPPEFQSTGIPMSEVQRFAANDYKLPMQAVLRTNSAAPIPTPAVMHVKDQHYCALLDRSENGGQYLLEDRTLRFAGWVDKAAVDALSSGNFLVATNDLPNGFESLIGNVTQSIFGRDGAHGTVPPDEDVDDNDPKCDDSFCHHGMPTYTFHPMPGAIRIGDIPLSYSTPVGPGVGFQINYNDMDSGAPTSPPTFTHVGVTWSTNWVAWVEHISGAPYNGQGLRVRVPGGGTQVVKYNTSTGQFGPHDQSFAVVTRTGTYTYTREMPDGSKEVYNSPDNAGAPARVFLSQIIDPQGNALTLGYDANIRLVSVTDTIGQVTTLAYTDAGNIYRVTRVTDPFGRFASLSYDAAGRLASVTDQIGLTTTFTYDSSSGFIATMVTPYGTSTFALPTNYAGSNRIVEAIDPLGGKERVEFNDTGSTFVASLREPPASVMVGNTVVPFTAENTRLQFRNAWYWDKLANEVAPGDYKAAKNFRFYTDVNWQVVPVIEATKTPNEDRVWINYPGGVSPGGGLPYYLGTSAQPEKVLRMLPDGTPQLHQTYMNAQGNLIKAIDPLGRTTEYIYAANGLDLVEVLQTTGGINERQLAITYNSQHQPLTITDASGQVTNYVYNARGQVLTVTNARNEVTTFTYDANGFRTAIDGPLVGNADSDIFTYDSVGRVQAITRSDGYSLTFNYDSFDRVVQTNYPDGTHEQTTFDKLDPATFRDRLGRLTTYAYNAIRLPSAVTDPLNRTVQMNWCRCGSLASLTDPMGRVTRWQRNLEGRVIAKVYADNSRIGYSYDDVGRIRRRTDEKGQHKDYSYFTDDSIRQITYPNAQIATPSVSYTYDAIYSRIATMKDGVGTTVYGYNAVTNSSSSGAGQLGSVDGPFDNDTIIYTYDALGRATGRAVNGVPSSITLDAMGRTTALTDSLGTFNLTYDGATNRVLSMTRPNNVSSFYQYFDNAGDRRLKQIKHQRIVDSSVISQFDYTYDAMGRILTWAQSSDGGMPDLWNLGYDAADQLTSVNVMKGGSPVANYAYVYDSSGNRLGKTEGGLVTTYSFNSLNEISSSSAVTPTTTYQWDAENRLASASVGGVRTDYSYDGLGRCVRTKDVGGSTTNSSAFIWVGPNRVEERDYSGSVVRRRFLLQGQTTETGATTAMFTMKDHIGTVHELLSQSGSILQRMAYGPFGETKFTLPSGPDAGMGFGELYYQSRLQLYFAMYRVYDPKLGRWLNRDPLGEAVGHNLFKYSRNRPTSVFDPLGLIDFDLFTPGSWEYSATRQFKDAPDVFDIGAHGDPNFVYDNLGNRYSPSDLYNMVKNDPNFKNAKTVKLWACNTASGGPNSFAEQFAKLSGKTTIGGTGYLEAPPAGAKDADGSFRRYEGNPFTWWNPWTWSSGGWSTYH